MNLDRPRVIVIGAGMAGILSVIRLREAGIDDVVVYEKADRLGGTWRENTYPGVACDVASHLYCYSFAPNPEWSHTFSPGDEILRYLEDVADRFAVVDVIRFGTEVTRMEWADQRWSVELDDGGRDEADFVIAATGVLHHPFVAPLPGLSDFEGDCFHSARWNHDIALDDARVGVVGTGSTAVQITSALAGRVGEYRLFQRTPQWVLKIPNDPIGDDIRASYRTDPAAMTAMRAELSELFEANFANAVVDADSAQVKMIEELCRMNLEGVVADPELRELLRPNYRAACKRLVISPDFYEAIQRPHTHLVADPIERVEAHGIRTADGTLHELDVIVLATGFRVDRFLRPIDVIGRGGVRLDDVWAQRPSAYLAVSIPDFPNLFLLNGPNGPVGNFSLIEVAEAQFSYIGQLIDAVRSRGGGAISASHAAAARWESERIDAAQRTIWVTGCRSWYLDDRGVPSAWPWSFTHFREAMAAPELADFDLVGAD